MPPRPSSSTSWNRPFSTDPLNRGVATSARRSGESQADPVPVPVPVPVVDPLPVGPVPVVTPVPVVVRQLGSPVLAWAGPGGGEGFPAKASPAKTPTSGATTSPSFAAAAGRELGCSSWVGEPASAGSAGGSKNTVTFRSGSPRWGAEFGRGPVISRISATMVECSSASMTRARR